MSDHTKKHKHEHIVQYMVYAAAAYFGIQFLFKPKTASGATMPTPAADPMPQPVYEPPPAATNTTAKSSSKKAAKWITESFPLRKGMKGSNIKLLQTKLGVSADGAFGEQTETVLMQQHGIKTVSKEKFTAIVQGSTSIFSKIADVFTGKTSIDTTPILKMGSKGQDVYRLQKWLGFKDKKQAKKGEPVADSAFGKQTQTALKQKTGQVTISTGQLNAALAKAINGMGQLGEIIITRRDTIVLNEHLHPHQRVRKNTLLGKRIMELTDPQQNKCFTQFQTIDGHRRWVDKEDV